MTGAAGYIGTLLVRRLLADGWAVISLDCKEHDIPTHFGECLRTYKADIRDQDTLQRALNSVDAVIHLAMPQLRSLAGSDPYREQIAYDIVVSSLRTIAKWARQRPTENRVVFASSCSVYGNETGIRTEASPVQPLDGYARVKCAGEQVLFNNPEVNALILRPATVCGLSPMQRWDLTINAMTISAVCNRRITLRDPHRVRPSVHIDDLVRVFATMLTTPVHGAGPRLFNVAYEPRSLLETARLVADRVGHPVEFDMVSDGPADCRSYLISSDHLKSTLGVTSKFTVSAAIESMILACRQGANL